MQKPQVDSSILAPAETISAIAPFLAIISSTCLEPGATPKLTSGNTLLPFNIDATIIRSRNDELVHEPTMTWSTFNPASSFTVPILSGECGFAIIGSIEPRSRSITLVYSASASAASSIHSDCRRCAFRNMRVISSLGKTDVVTPSSAPMLVMVARSGTESVLIPSPPYSITMPTLPLVVSILRTVRMTSLADTQGWSFPERLTFSTLGQVR